MLAQFSFADGISGEIEDGYLHYFTRQQDLRERRFIAMQYFFETS